jgi:AMMECR1 domain-containing protein
MDEKIAGEKRATEKIAPQIRATSLLALLTILFASGPAALGRGETNDKPIPLNKIAEATLLNHFSEHPKSINQLVKSFTVPNAYKQSRGLFVTLSKNGKTRACWGSIQPQEGNLIAASIIACEEALSKEYRYPPIRKNEINQLKCQVTVIEKIEAVGAHASLSPLIDGLMVRSGAKAAVLLPGEASDPHYQVMQCKLKAGINPQDPCQIYRMRAHVFR